MTKFIEYLNEKSFGKEDIPEYFWVVFDLREMKDQLKTRKVKGLKGISSSNTIQFEFLGVARDAMLQIPSKDLLKANDVTRIMYDNPHYFVSNNLWALRRIYNSSPNRWANQVFGNLFEQIQKRIKDRQLKYDMEYHGFRNVDYDWSKKIQNKKINNIKQLSEVIKKYIENIFSEKTGRDYEVKLTELQSIVYESLLEIGRIYSSENEWVVKNKVFTIPKSSVLYVLGSKPDNFNQEFYDVMKDNIKTNMMDLIFVLQEYDFPESLKKQSHDYKDYARMKEQTKDLKDYKIVEYNFQEFKRKQKEFFESKGVKW